MLWQETPFAPVAMVHVRIEATEVYQMYEVRTYHLLVCDTLGLDPMSYEVPAAHKMSNEQIPLE
jgi:hypothetical protein